MISACTLVIPLNYNEAENFLFPNKTPGRKSKRKGNCRRRKGSTPRKFSVMSLEKAFTDLNKFL
jgi:hypothetical protein